MGIWLTKIAADAEESNDGMVMDIEVKQTNPEEAGDMNGPSATSVLVSTSAKDVASVSTASPSTADLSLVRLDKRKSNAQPQHSPLTVPSKQRGLRQI